MVVAFENSGSFAKAVYGDASSQHAGSSGTINMNDVRSSGVGGPVMKGGRKRSSARRSDKKRSAKRSDKKRSDKKRSSRMRQNGGKSKSRKQQKGGK
jgi:hypothetical protein